MLAALAFVAAAAAAWRRQRSRCFLLDFACYKPPDALKVGLKDFLVGSRNFGVRARQLRQITLRSHAGQGAVFVTAFVKKGALRILILILPVREVGAYYVAPPASALTEVSERPIMSPSSKGVCLAQSTNNAAQWAIVHDLAAIDLLIRRWSWNRT